MTNDADSPTEARSGPGLVFALWAAALLLACFGFTQDTPVGNTDGLAQAGTNETIALSVYVFAMGIALAIFQAPPPVAETDVLDTPLCGHCVRPFRDGVHFCPRCSAPLTVFAATAEYESVYAQTWVFGKAIKHPTSLLHVIGIATVTGPTLLSLPTMLIAGGVLSADYYGPTYADFAGFAVTATFIYIYLLMTIYCWRNWRSLQEEPELAPPESEYGSPPWWTYDAAWALREDSDTDSESVGPESAPGDESDAETGGDAPSS